MRRLNMMTLRKIIAISGCMAIISYLNPTMAYLKIANPPGQQIGVQYAAPGWEAPDTPVKITSQGNNNPVCPKINLTVGPADQTRHIVGDAGNQLTRGDSPSKCSYDVVESGGNKFYLGSFQMYTEDGGESCGINKNSQGPVNETLQAGVDNSHCTYTVGIANNA